MAALMAATAAALFLAFFRMWKWGEPTTLLLLLFSSAWNPAAAAACSKTLK